ncbi:MAG: hypothetical protein K8J09_02775, partial [Planctomycetes bacterium]|nr:hypothetical protein [Planctomycetota bacterium]
RLNGSSWENYYLLHGGQDTAAKLVNTSGVVVEQYEYDPYGRVSVYVGGSTHPVASSAYGLPFLWKSIRLDEITGLLQMRNRYYSTELGRFLTEDPLGVWGDEANGGSSYCYVADNPMVRGDALGLQNTPTLRPPPVPRVTPRPQVTPGPSGRAPRLPDFPNYPAHPGRNRPGEAKTAPYQPVPPGWKPNPKNRIPYITTPDGPRPPEYPPIPPRELRERLRPVMGEHFDEWGWEDQEDGSAPEPSPAPAPSPGPGSGGGGGLDVDDCEQPKRCRPCFPPVGTKMGWVDSGHPHAPYGDPHSHYHVMHQTTYPGCICKWGKKQDTYAPLPSDVIPIPPYKLPAPAGGGPG